jgi:hypothetical protein
MIRLAEQLPTGVDPYLMPLKRLVQLQRRVVWLQSEIKRLRRKEDREIRLLLEPQKRACRREMTREAP